MFACEVSDSADVIAGCAMVSALEEEASGCRGATGNDAFVAG